MTEREEEHRRIRKHPELWQAYLWWYELEKMRLCHEARIGAVERGVANYSAEFERDQLKRYDLRKLERGARKLTIEYGEMVGPIWTCLRTVRGLKAGADLVRLLARIDDIGKFARISNLWAFAGFAVRDGEIDHYKGGKKGSYDKVLKSIALRIADQFVRQRTPVYREAYEEYYEADRRKHPNVICQHCHTAFDPEIKKCPKCKRGNTLFNLLYCAAHMDARAKRKVAKLFLGHLWLRWRELEGLSISPPYVQGVLGHTNIIDPPF